MILFQAASVSPMMNRYHSNTENPLIKIKKSSPIRRMREEKSESKWDDFMTQSAVRDEFIKSS